MTIEEALVIVDTVLKPGYLNQVQELVLRQSWEGRTYSEIAANYGYDSDYVKNVGFGLWQSLSEKLGEKVSKSNFRSIVRRLSSQVVNRVGNDAENRVELASSPVVHLPKEEAGTPKWEDAGKEEDAAKSIFPVFSHAVSALPSVNASRFPLSPLQSQMATFDRGELAESCQCDRTPPVSKNTVPESNHLDEINVFKDTTPEKIWLENSEHLTSQREPENSSPGGLEIGNGEDSPGGQVKNPVPFGKHLSLVSSFSQVDRSFLNEDRCLLEKQTPEEKASYYSLSSVEHMQREREEKSDRRLNPEKWRVATEKEWEKRRSGERERESLFVEETKRDERGWINTLSDRPLPLNNYPTKIIINRRQDWEKTIDVSVFYGRAEEKETLKQWLVEERCRLIALFGMGGIGKTALSLKVAQELTDRYECVIWRSLLRTLAVPQLLLSWIKFINPQHTSDLPEDLDSCISCLVEYLQKHRCLLVIDDMEVILRSGDRAGYYREGYEDYGVLFKRLAKEVHDSTILIASREQPKELAFLSGKKVRSLQLQGLSESAAWEIFQEKGCFEEQEDDCKKVIQLYQGNPLALKIVSTTIQELFDGNVAAFLAQGTVVFGDIRDLLDEQFSRLSDLEKEIMYWLAVERQPVSLAELRQNLTTLSVLSSELLEALESLKRRSLIDNISGSFTQKPAIAEYMNNRLIAQIYQKKTTQDALPYSSHVLINRLFQNPKFIKHSYNS